MSSNAPATAPVAAARPTPSRKGPYPWTLGGISATLAAGLTHPLDLAKVRMQTKPGASKNLFFVLADSVKENGLRRGAYTGLSASMLRQMTYSLTRFGVYDVLKTRLRSPQDGKTLPLWKLTVAASIAGGLGGVAGNPADILLVRMTSDSVKPPSQQLRYRNPVDGLYRMVTQEGVGSLFRGLMPNTVRAVLMNCGQLVTYDSFKNMLLSTNLLQEGILLHFLTSTCAGTVATTICAPFDVVKSRIMSSSGQQSIAEIVSKSFKEEGARWMFRGWTAAWLRLGPNTVAVFMILEQLRNVIDWSRSSN